MKHNNAYHQIVINDMILKVCGKYLIQFKTILYTTFVTILTCVIVRSGENVVDSYKNDGSPITIVNIIKL